MKKMHYKSLVAAAILTGLSQQGAMATELAPIGSVQDTWVILPLPSVDKKSVHGGKSSIKIDKHFSAFVQFVIPTLPVGEVIDKVILKLKVPGGGKAIPDTYISEVTEPDVVWDEAVVNEDTYPFVVGNRIPGAEIEATTTSFLPADESNFPIQPGDTPEFDITSAVSGAGTYTFNIDMEEKTELVDRKYVGGKFVNTANVRPHLLITTKLAPASDTTPPVFTDIAPIEINATGTNTDISSLVNITATDDTDGAITATIIGNSSFISGAHTVTLQATDIAGNQATKEVTVNITPLVVLTQPVTLELPPGETASASVALSGPAVSYPASIGYTIAGDATSDTNGTLTFAADNYADGQSVAITLANDAQGTQTAVLTLTAVSNVQANNETVTVTTFDGNLPPSLTLTLTQGGVTIATISAANVVAIPSIDAAKGDVTVTVDVFDFNDEDLHTVTWPETSVDLGATAKDFVFSPKELSGDYALNVSAIEDNTSEKFATLLAANIRIIKEVFPELVAGEDTDGDGILDTDEGFNDTDGDGIVDYLDGNPDTTQLPLSAEQKPLQTLPGLTLSLGTVANAKGISADSAIITSEDLAIRYSDLDTSDSGFLPVEGTSLFNFTVNGLASGAAVPVVYPLPKNIIITKETEYRKYTPKGGWVTFISDADNTIASAAKDENGNCPAPNDALYDHGLGLQENDNCIQLTIKDGDIYDADGTENGIIEDPGVLAESYTVIEWSADSIELPATNVNEGSNVILTADLTTHVGGADISTLTFAKDEGPAWLTVDETGALSANLSKVASGDYTATISFMDNKAQTAQTEVKVSVAFNNAPKLAAVELAAASRNEAYSASLAELITDADGDSFTVTKVGGPHWLKVSETGQLSGTPLKANIGDNNITVELTDDKGAANAVTFNIPVADSQVRASGGGSFSAGLLALLGLISLGRRKLKK
ncbi:MAG: hypothetical protein HRT55_16780 [Colwellia sp.]|uniref:choice-of-anchor U domain-containing protein n=2 Tax=Alteromonadales TaxID=135622 RepID=UPI0025BAAACD|nr:choice-of-anchor U domain-containing protein [Colwellia sp.]NQZ27963.1 hypothetical protein [Colwellia sp.]